MDKYFYHAIAYRDGKYWVINFPDHDELFTQAKGFKELELMSKDLINLVHEIPEENIELAITLYFDDDFMDEDLLQFIEDMKTFHKGPVRSVLDRVKSLYFRDEAERVAQVDK